MAAKGCVFCVLLTNEKINWRVGDKVLSLDNEKKSKLSFCIVLAYSYLWIRYFRSEKKGKTSFPFAFRSLIRTFA